MCEVGVRWRDSDGCVCGGLVVVDEEKRLKEEQRRQMEAERR